MPDSTPTPHEARIEAVFHEARAIASPDERRRFLDLACGDDGRLRENVDSFLDAEIGDFLKTASGLAAHPDAAAPGTTGAAPLETPGSIIDRYELLEELGQGGFGTVFMARQTMPNSPRVALKIVKPGMDTRQVLARFEIERASLAMMEHPHIARVFDAGATDNGRPFFVMELVDGEAITAYADQHGLTIRERLELFRQVCAAVQHAHQKGVIHRDLKPSNILVANVDGKHVPKVIDFGIAKATADPDGDQSMLTQQGLFIGTPQYMSPEQAGLSGVDVDTRTDVYSLGVVLYELLTGTTPLDPERLRNATPSDVQRLVAEATSPRPSTRLAELETRETIAATRGAAAGRLRLALKRDLDWIGLQALERDRTRRYQTAHELAEDVRRFLDDEPVVARPPSASYRLRKFVRKNRVPVAAAATIAAALLIGITGTTIALVWALATKEELAETNVALDRVVDFQTARIGAIDVAKMGLDIRSGVLAQARAKKEREGLEPAQIDREIAQLETQLAGANFTSLALDVTDRNLFDPTEAAIEQEFADQPLLRAQLLHTQGELLTGLGLYERSDESLAQALEIRRAQLGEDHPDTLESLARMGELLRRRGRLVEATPYYEQSLDGFRRALGDDDLRTLEAVHAMGVLSHHQGRLDDADRDYRQAIEGFRRLAGPNDARTLRALSNLGAVHHARQRLDEAEACYRTAYEGFRETFGDDHDTPWSTLYNLSLVINDKGNADEAERLALQAREGIRRALGEDHPSTLECTNGLATFFYEQERMEEAAAMFGAILASRRRILGDRHPQTITSVASLAAAVRELGRLEEAAALGAESEEGARVVLAGHPFLGIVLVEHGRTLTAMHLYEEAEPRLLEGHALLERTLGAGAPHTADAACGIADLYDAWHADAPNQGHDEQARQWRTPSGTPPASEEDPPAEG